MAVLRDFVSASVCVFGVPKVALWGLFLGMMVVEPFLGRGALLFSSSLLWRVACDHHPHLGGQQCC